MPKKADSLLRYWPVWVGIVTVLSWGVNEVRLYQQHRDEDAVRDERIRVLRDIVNSEFPQYSPALWPEKD